MKVYEIPSELEWRLEIRKPSGKRKSFGIRKRWLAPVTKRETLQDKRIDSVNRLLAQASITPREAVKELQRVIEAIYREAGVKVVENVANRSNLDRLNEFWENEYAYRDLVDPESMYNDYRRAIECLGKVSLATGSAQDMNKEIRKRCEGKPGKQRRVVARLNTLIKYFRPKDRVILRKLPPPRKVVQYLTEDQLAQVLKHVGERHLRIMIKVAFYSGCRQGELFALESRHWKDGGQIQVLGQVDRSGTLRDTKTRRERLSAFTGPKKVFHEWVVTKGEVTTKERHDISKTLKNACRKAFPQDRSKWVTFHDLRHSYAIYLAEAGVSIGHIAKCLGNSQMVCEQYYVGFGQTSDSIEMIQRKVTEFRDEDKKRKP